MWLLLPPSRQYNEGQSTLNIICAKTVSVWIYMLVSNIILCEVHIHTRTHTRNTMTGLWLLVMSEPMWFQTARKCFDLTRNMD